MYDQFLSGKSFSKVEVKGQVKIWSLRHNNRLAIKSKPTVRLVEATSLHEEMFLSPESRSVPTVGL